MTPPRSTDSTGSAAQLVELVAGLAPRRPRVLLATGPLTDVARMLEIEPDLGRMLDRVVVMGGAFGAPGGNVTPHAEFNIWVDPEAAAAVLAAGLPLLLVPLDVTTRVVLVPSDADRLDELSGTPSLVSRLVRVGSELYQELLGTPFCEMHDPLAAALLFRPGLVTTTWGSVEVTTEGDERGRTSYGGTAPEIEVASAVDVDGARRFLLDVLAEVADR